MLHAPVLYSQQNSFTTTGTQEIVTTSASGIKMQAVPSKFALQVSGLNSSGTTQAASAWNVALEGSLDGYNWTAIQTHVSGTNADGVVVWGGSNFYEVNYIRLHCISLTLGSAAKILVTALGVD